MKNKKSRRILINGEIVKTKKEPEYVLCYHDKENDVWHYLSKNEVHKYYPGRPRYVVVSRFTKKEIKHKIKIYERYSAPGSILSLLKPVKFKIFSKSIGKISKVLDSVDDWLEYFDNELVNDDFKIKKLKKILNGEI